ncbi:FliH/SctL family protein [Trichococcus sp. K1Tr]|uniref:FliH/SctL family protein n=1 Tax=Trichococcus sp. K1Tr TaxID=3020847 RepID=UPI00232CDA8C|nr:FliH/SctL family protein [Trichococcus sp. K1Tr]MDB6353463.1 FliH/SctL family protein [Trichococcus sp. K1Tr]
MPSSHNIIKSHQWKSDETTSDIDTKLSVIQKASLLSHKKTGMNDKRQADASTPFAAQAEQIGQLLLEAQEERQSVIAQAVVEADLIKHKAKEEGMLEGKELGMQEGFLAGYEKGRQEGLETLSKIRGSLLNQLKETDTLVSTYYKENKEAIIELAAQMAEQIVHHSIDRTDESIMLLLNPILKRMEKNEPFITITVRPDDAETIRIKVNEHEMDEFTARYVVLSDDTLEKNGCIIECSRSIIDLQIKKQLAAIVADLNVLGDNSHV